MCSEMGKWAIRNPKGIAVLALFLLSVGGLASACNDLDESSEAYWMMTGERLEKAARPDTYVPDTATDCSPTCIVSGLTWENPPMGGTRDWSGAKQYCLDLVLAGQGDWRLPTIGELRSLIRGCPATESGGSCNVEDGDCLAWACRYGSCSGCYNNSGPADGCYWPDSIQGGCAWYWSSSPVEDNVDFAWYVIFDNGHVYNCDVSYSNDVRCVR